MARKKRTYNTRRIKRDYSYRLQEISECLEVHKNAVRNWLKEGLPKIDEQKPFMIHGSDLIAFLNKRQAGRKHKCKDNEFFCCKCRVPRKAKSGSINFIIRNETKLNIHGKCEACDTSVFRAGSVKKRAEYEQIFANEAQAKEHITDRKTPTVNCHLKEDEKHEEKDSQISPPKRAYQADLFSVLEGG